MLIDSVEIHNELNKIALSCSKTDACIDSLDVLQKVRKILNEIETRTQKQKYRSIQCS